MEFGSFENDGFWGTPPTPCELSELHKLFISYDLGPGWHNLHDFHFYNHCVYGRYIASLAVTHNPGDYEGWGMLTSHESWTTKLRAVPMILTFTTAGGVTGIRPLVEMKV